MTRISFCSQITIITNLCSAKPLEKFNGWIEIIFLLIFRSHRSFTGNVSIIPPPFLSGYFFTLEILYEHEFVGPTPPNGLLFQMPHYNKGAGTLPPSRASYLSREKLLFVLLSYTSRYWFFSNFHLSRCRSPEKSKQ